jgi:methanogenic corrinoid protein MtbC1
MEMADLEKLVQAIGLLDEGEAVAILNQVMADGGGDAEKALEACQKGMDIVGDLFQKGDYFVADLIYSGELMTDAVEILQDALIKGDSGRSKTKMILCTVKDDIHDIGKNIVKAMLIAGGFDVIDLGINVVPEKIVEVAKTEGIGIVALSGVLTLAIDSMKATVEAFADAAMRNGVKIIIGGSPVDADVCSFVGADAWSVNPQEGVKICRTWADAR